MNVLKTEKKKLRLIVLNKAAKQFWKRTGESNTKSLRLTKNNFASDHAFLYISLSSMQYCEIKMRPKFTFFAKTATQDNDFVFLFLNFYTV